MTLRTETVSTLVHWLERGDEADRCYASQALARLGDPAAIAPLIERLRDEDIDVCVEAARALGELGGETVVPALIESLKKDPSGEVGTAVVEALGRIGGDDAVAALIRVAEKRPGHLHRESDWDDWWDMQLKAVEALGRLGATAAVPVLAGILDDEEGQDIEVQALLALARIGGEADRILLARLKAGDPRTRRRVARALAEGDSAASVVALGRALQDNDPDVCVAAIQGLAARNARAYAGAILLMVKEQDPAVRAAALEASGQWRSEGHTGPELGEELTAALGDASAAVRATALAVLRRLHRDAGLSPVLTTLTLSLLGDPEELVAEEACRLLGVSRSRTAVPALMKVVGEPARPATVRREAALALGRLGDTGEPVCQALERALLDDAQPVRFGAVKALARLGARPPATASDPLAPLLRAVGGTGSVTEDISPEPDDPADGGETAIEATPDGDADKAALEEALAGHASAIPFDAQPDQRGAASTLDAIAMDNVAVALALSGENAGATPQAVDAETGDYLEIVRQNRADHDFVKRPRQVEARVDVRRVAARALGECDRPEVIEALIETLRDSDGGLRQAASESLGRIAARNPDAPGLQAALGALATQLAVGEPTVRVSAAHAIAALRNRAALPLLLAALEDESDELRIAAATGIDQLLHDAHDPAEADHMVTDEVSVQEVLQCLRAHLQDPAAGVRLRCAEALGRAWAIAGRQRDVDDVVMELIAAATLGAGAQARTMGRVLGSIDTPAANRRLLNRLDTLATSAERRFVIEMLEELYPAAQPAS